MRRTVRGDLDTMLPGLFWTAGRVLALSCPEEAALEAGLSAVSGPDVGWPTLAC